MLRIQLVIRSANRPVHVIRKRNVKCSHIGILSGVQYHCVNIMSGGSGSRSGVVSGILKTFNKSDPTPDIKHIYTHQWSSFADRL